MGFAIGAYRRQVEDFLSLMREGTGFADLKLGPGKWTLKEMVGHLIDSASNNHQRFVRLQLAERVELPGYEAEAWTAATGIGALDYGFVVDFWRQYNELLLHLVATAREDCYGHVWASAEGDKRLDFLVPDYFAHLELHRRMFAERLKELRSAAG